MIKNIKFLQKNDFIEQNNQLLNKAHKSFSNYEILISKTIKELKSGSTKEVLSHEKLLFVADLHLGLLMAIQEEILFSSLGLAFSEETLDEALDMYSEGGLEELITDWYNLNYTPNNGLENTSFLFYKIAKDMIDQRTILLFFDHLSFKEKSTLDSLIKEKRKFVEIY